MNKGSETLRRKRKRMSAPLSEDLSSEYDVGSMGVKRGDTVRILRGDFRGIEGRITEVDLKEGFINVEGATREKSDGTILFANIHPSKVCITELDLNDPRRREIVERRAIYRRSRR